MRSTKKGDSFRKNDTYNLAAQLAAMRPSDCKGCRHCPEVDYAGALSAFFKHIRKCVNLIYPSSLSRLMKTYVFTHLFLLK